MPLEDVCRQIATNGERPMTEDDDACSVIATYRSGSSCDETTIVNARRDRSQRTSWSTRATFVDESDGLRDSVMSAMSARRRSCESGLHRVHPASTHRAQSISALSDASIAIFMAYREHRSSAFWHSMAIRSNCKHYCDRIPFRRIAEQTAIAAFLDRETAKIDGLVAEQRRLIELLKEKRQAVISHAVTKGLNPHAPMKPSGIEWLGDVPAHWDVTPIERISPTSEIGSTLDEITNAYWSDADLLHGCDSWSINRRRH